MHRQLPNLTANNNGPRTFNTSMNISRSISPVNRVQNNRSLQNNNFDHALTFEEELLQKNARLECFNSQYEDRIKNLTYKFDESEKNCDYWKDELNEVTKTHSQLQSDYDSLKQKQDTLLDEQEFKSSEFNILSSEHEGLKKCASTNYESLGQNSKDLQDFKLKNSTLEREVYTAKEENKILQRKIDRQDLQIISQKDAMDINARDHQNKTERINIKIDQLELSIVNADRTIENAKQFIRDEDKLENEREEIKKFQLKMDEYLKNYGSSLEEQKKEQNSIKSEIKKVASNLSTELNTVSNTILEDTKKIVSNQKDSKLELSDKMTKIITINERNLTEEVLVQNLSQFVAFFLQNPIGQLISLFQVVFCVATLIKAWLQ